MLAIVAPMATELSGIRRAIRDPEGRGIAFSLTGVGAARTRARIQRIAESEPEAIIMVGFCGGVDAGLRVGDLHVASAYHSVGAISSDVISADPDLSASIIAAAHRGCNRAVWTGSSATVNAVADTAAKLAVHEATGAASVNMEDYWAADVARAAGVPFASIRAVLDTAGEKLPDWISENDESVARIMGCLVSRPRRVPGLIRIARQAMIARRSLTCCVAGLIDALGSPRRNRSAAPK